MDRTQATAKESDRGACNFCLNIPKSHTWTDGQLACGQRVEDLRRCTSLGLSEGNWRSSVSDFHILGVDEPSVIVASYVARKAFRVLFAERSIDELSQWLA